MRSRLERFFHDTPNRYIGAENEYTTSFTRGIYELSDFITSENVAFEDSPEDLWLNNGARIYLDCNDLVEYATPECYTPEQVLLYEKTGEATVESLASSLDLEDNRKAYKRSAYHEVKNSDGTIILGEQGGGGHHENYQTPLRFNKSDRKSAAQLESFLSTRSIWAGAGIVGPTGYELCQKSLDITPLPIESADATNTNCIQDGAKLIMRHNSDGDRLEVRLGDGNMSPWAIRTKFAMTSFVLRLLEHGSFPSDVLIGATRGQLRRRMSVQPDYHFQTETGIDTTAALHQQSIARACLDFSARHPEFDVPKSEINAALDIESICCDIDEYLNGKDNLHELATQIDWAAKRHRIHKHGITDREISTQNLEAVKLDLDWETLGDDSPSARWYRKHGNTCGTREINRALKTPPSEAARLRVNYLRDHDGEVYSPSWDSALVYSNFYAQERINIYYEDE